MATIPRYPKVSTQNLVRTPGFDFDVPSPLSQAVGRRMAEQQAADAKLADMKLSPLDKAVSAMKATASMGTMLFQAIQQAPKALQGEDAYTEAIGNAAYIPQDPKALEYMGDFGNMLEKLETEYKIPNLMPELVPFQSLAGLARTQANQAVEQGATRAGMAAERALDKPVFDIMNRGGRGAELLSSFATNPAQVVKQKGGNWLAGSFDNALRPLKRNETAAKSLEEMRSVYPPEVLETLSPETRETVTRAFPHLEKEVALNNWVDRNLTNYVKKEMATPEDPVRKLAEEGIVHIPSNQVGVNRYRAPQHREVYGGEQLGQSEAARAWEDASDVAINAPRAKAIKENESLYQKNPWIEKLPNEERVYALNSPASYDSEVSGLGFDHILDVLRQDVASGRIRPEQLNKVSMEQAVRRTYEFDQEQARKMAETQAKVTEGMPVHKEYPEGYRWIELTTPKLSDVLPEGWSEPVAKGNTLQIKSADGKVVLGNDLPELIKNIYRRHPETPGNPEKVLEDALKYEGDTMGHCVGGYCPDVLEGRSRIYSLRDKRGEPHVTVEVRPKKESAYWNDIPEDVSEQLRIQGEGIGNKKADELGHSKWGNERDAEIKSSIARLKDDWIYNNPKISQSIVQIKGKQNAAPKEDYLPYVQDFVRSGDWSDVGDFKNTGLMRAEDVKKAGWDMGDIDQKYLTKQEYDDLLLKQLGNPPAEGMKRGGAVNISDNPDAMMMELEDQKFAGGGAAKKILSKLVRAPAKSAEDIRAVAQRMAPQIIGEEFVRGEKGTQSIAGKTQKQFAREKELKHDIRPTGAERPTPEPVDLEKLKGSVMIGIPGDPTISGQTVHSVAGQPLVSPSPQHGGPLYGLGREDEAFWASGLGAANRVQNLAREAGKQYEAPVVGKYIMMGPESINYAQHFADANLSAIDPTKMRKSDIEGFNNLIRKGSPASGPRPAFPGIENPEEAYLQFAIDPELRKHFNALMQMPTVTERFNLPSGQDVRHAITEPDLRNLETGVTGKSMGEMKPEITELGLSEHPTYSHDIPGKFLGSSEVPTPYELSFPDTLKAIQENPKQAAHEFGSLKMVGPRQIIDPQLIDELSMYRDFIKQYTGKKDGGLIKVKRKAGGGIISKAAKEALERIKPAKAEMAAKGALWDKKAAEDASKYTRDIDPFNPSMEDIQAEIQRMQSKQDVRKAIGGAINANDLILTERPL